MNILVIGNDSKQLRTWADKHLPQNVLKSTNGRVLQDGDCYYFFVARPHDDRVLGMTFDRIVQLDETPDHAGQYTMRLKM